MENAMSGWEETGILSLNSEIFPDWMFACSNETYFDARNQSFQRKDGEHQNVPPLTSVPCPFRECNYAQSAAFSQTPSSPIPGASRDCNNFQSFAISTSFSQQTPVNITPVEQTQIN